MLSALLIENAGAFCRFYGNFYWNKMLSNNILNKIRLPKTDQTVQKNLDETRKLQKNISSIEDSEEKKKKRKSEQVQKDK